MNSKSILVLFMAVGLSFGGELFTLAQEQLQQEGWGDVPLKAVSFEGVTTISYISRNESVTAIATELVSKSETVQFIVFVEGGLVQKLQIVGKPKGPSGRLKNKFWLRQFEGVTPDEVRRDIDAVSGATLASGQVQKRVGIILEYVGTIQ